MIKENEEHVMLMWNSSTFTPLTLLSPVSDVTARL